VNINTDKTKDGVKKIADTAKDKIVYLPFVGWLITLTVDRGGDDFIIFHIKQSFAMAFGFTVCLTALGFLLSLMRYGILNFVFVITVYVVYLLYFVLSVIGTRAVLRGKKIEFPVIGGYAARLNI